MHTLLLRPKNTPPVTPPQSDEGHAPSRTGDRAIRCRACGHPVTTTAARVAVFGAHAHVFCNPNGNVFEIGCFALAPGCGLEGEPRPEFTWFPGHAWRIALCRGCRAHLGWHFAIMDTPGFFGLILAGLVEDDG